MEVHRTAHHPNHPENVLTRAISAGVSQGFVLGGCVYTVVKSQKIDFRGCALGAPASFILSATVQYAIDLRR